MVRERIAALALGITLLALLIIGNVVMVAAMWVTFR